MKTIVWILGALVVGVGVGVGVWALLPLVYDREVHEGLEDIVPNKGAQPGVTAQPINPGVNPNAPVSTVATEPQVIKTGTFVGLEGHQAQGTAQLIKIGSAYYVRFSEDFRTTNGPDLVVHFGNNGVYASEAYLGDLKGNVGAQNYEVPVAINVNNYNEVWVWCRAFSVPFGKVVFSS